ncbi:hypothetical protein C8F01DRAFT_1326026 [Mycena amicta]|nr:hypothetical protein C8F01DRAFT_1326026 [Mycena amicta]
MSEREFSFCHKISDRPFPKLYTTCYWCSEFLARCCKCPAEGQDVCQRFKIVFTDGSCPRNGQPDARAGIGCASGLSANQQLSLPANNWKNKQNARPANLDLFRRLDALAATPLANGFIIQFFHVPREFNTLADRLARAEMWLQLVVAAPHPAHGLKMAPYAGASSSSRRTATGTRRFLLMLLTAAGCLHGVGALQIVTPGTLVVGQQATISWTSVSTDREFSIQIVGSALQSAITVVSIVPPNPPSFEFIVPSVSPGDDYIMEFVSTQDFNDILAQSGEFSIVLESSSSGPSTSSPSTSSPSPTSSSSVSQTSSAPSGIPTGQSSNPSPPTSNSKKRVSPGAIAGIVIGCVALVVIAACMFFVLWRRSRLQPEAPDQSSAEKEIIDGPDPARYERWYRTQVPGDNSRKEPALVLASERAQNSTRLATTNDTTINPEAINALRERVQVLERQLLVERGSVVTRSEPPDYTYDGHMHAS